MKTVNLLTPDSYWWFFSAVAQVFGAVIGILGVFTVYALQQIGESAKATRADIVNVMKRVVPGSNYGVFGPRELISTIEERLKHLREDGSKDPAVGEAERLVAQVGKLKDRRTDLLNSATKLIAFMIATLILSLVALALVQIASNLTLSVLLILVLAASVIELMSMGGFISRTLRQD